MPLTVYIYTIMSNCWSAPCGVYPGLFHFPQGEKPRFHSAPYNHKLNNNGPVAPFPWTCIRISLMCILKSRTVELEDGCILNLMKSWRIGLQKGCSSLLLSKTWHSVVFKFHSFMGWTKRFFSL